MDRDYPAIERDYPAIERALNILKNKFIRSSQLNENCKQNENNNNNDVSNTLIDQTTPSSITIQSTKSRSMPLWKKAVIMTNKMEKQKQVLRRLGYNSYDNEKIPINTPSVKDILSIILARWKLYSKRNKIKNQLIFERIECLMSPNIIWQTFTLEMRSRCVKRFGKERLALLFRRWVIKRKVFLIFLRQSINKQNLS
jgi:hypothetical protein